MTPMNPFPVFWARCAQCNGSYPSTSLVPGVEPWTYVCWSHADPIEWLQQTRHMVEEFDKLTEEQQHGARVMAFGQERANEIRLRARLKEARR